MELLLGSGSARDRRISVNGRDGWSKLVTLDCVSSHKPDVVHDLNAYPWPFEDDAFSEIHAYELVEHLGRQGDAASFFQFFGEVWRILEPGGFFVATCPSYKSMWAFGDPSHTRVITSGTLAFLDQNEYALQVGDTPMSDFRDIWHRDLETVWADLKAEAEGSHLAFVLRAVKPSRWESR